MKWLLIAADTIAAVAAFFIAYTVRNFGLLSRWLDPIQQPLDVYLRALPFAVLLLLLILRLRGLYHPRTRITPATEIFEVVKSVTLWSLLIMAGSYLVKYDYSRLIVVLYWLTAATGIAATRSVLSWLIARRRPLDALLSTNVLIVGTGRPAKTIAQQLAPYRRHGYRLVGHVGRSPNGLPTIGTLDDLPRLLWQHRVHQVYLAEPTLPYRDTLNLISRCPKPDVEFRVTANIFPRVNVVTFLNDLEAIPSLDLSRAQPTWWRRTVKRSVDLVVGGVMLLLSLPAWAAIATAIRLDSPGPAILRQTRVGKDGKPFTLYKFRTMAAATAPYADAPRQPDDGRITRLGRFLRRTSLDELPQLWNVVRGEMSLVGPRPEMPQVVERYETWERKRLIVKPGLTGLWQILGRKDLPLHENLEYDFYYVNNQSLILDLVILAKTVPQIIFGRGAY